MLTGCRRDVTLKTFAAAAASSTLDAAARSLDIKIGSLRRTFRVLEGAIGEPLVVDDLRRDAPLRLTPVGDRLLRQGQEHHRLVPFLDHSGMPGVTTP